jgi:hypothetical protein
MADDGGAAGDRAALLDLLREATRAAEEVRVSPHNLEVSKLVRRMGAVVRCMACGPPIYALPQALSQRTL